METENSKLEIKLNYEKYDIHADNSQLNFTILTETKKKEENSFNKNNLNQSNIINKSIIKNNYNEEILTIFDYNLNKNEIINNQEPNYTKDSFKKRYENKKIENNNFKINEDKQNDFDIPFNELNNENYSYNKNNEDINLCKDNLQNLNPIIHEINLDKENKENKDLSNLLSENENDKENNKYLKDKENYINNNNIKLNDTNKLNIITKENRSGNNNIYINQSEIEVDFGLKWKLNESNNNHNLLEVNRFPQEQEKCEEILVYCEPIEKKNNNIKIDNNNNDKNNKANANLNSFIELHKEFTLFKEKFFFQL